MTAVADGRLVETIRGRVLARLDADPDTGLGLGFGAGAAVPG